MISLEYIYKSLLKFLEEPDVRWFFYLLAIVFTVFIFIQEPVRFSGNKSFLGVNMKWHYYILAVINAFNYMWKWHRK